MGYLYHLGCVVSLAKPEARWELDCITAFYLLVCIVPKIFRCGFSACVPLYMVG